MTKFLTLAALPLLGLATPALAASVDPAAIATANAAAPDSSGGSAKKASAEKTYCVNMQPSTGSRLSQRQCLTKAQWEEQGIEIKAKQ